MNIASQLLSAYPQTEDSKWIKAKYEELYEYVEQFKKDKLKGE